MNARLLIHLLLLSAATLASAQSEDETLTTALQVRSLSAEQAKEGRPVRLRATVHFIERPGTVFVQDATAGTFFRTKQPLGGLLPGDVVEVVGKTFPGLFLTGVETDDFKVVGQGELPVAQRVSPDDLISARFHYQRVSVEGIVRVVTPLIEEEKTILQLAMGTRVIEIRVDAEAWLVDDAQVRVTGLAAGTINDLRQLVQPYVRVASWDDVEILRPAPTSWDDLNIIKPSQLLRFDAAGADGHRLVVEGEVTANFPKRGMIFMRDEAGSIAVQVQDEKIKLGGLLKIPGFAEMHRFTPTLVDTGETMGGQTGPPPVPLSTSLAELRRKVRDGDLIQLSGLVTETYHSKEEVSIQIADAGQSLRAMLDGDVAVQQGEQVQLTGIARVEEVSGKGFNARPLKFSLWLRSPEDVRILRAPSPWTVQRLLTILGVLGLAGVAALVWIVMLRRQVAGLQQRVRHEAMLEERQRIAREFHDTLEQELAGLSLRLDAAASRPLEDKAKALLDTSRSLVSRVQSEARNLVADLRDEASLALALPEALNEMAQRLPANAPQIVLRCKGPLPVLPASVVHQLRMIAQEGVTNAIKHAQATTITLELEARESQLQLVVADDGSGFDPESRSHGVAGHFGCMGIRERCRKLGAEVRWQSAPGHGTRMEVTCPL